MKVLMLGGKLKVGGRCGLELHVRILTLRSIRPWTPSMFGSTDIDHISCLAAGESPLSPRYCYDASSPLNHHADIVPFAARSSRSPKRIVDFGLTGSRLKRRRETSSFLRHIQRNLQVVLDIEEETSAAAPVYRSICTSYQ